MIYTSGNNCGTKFSSDVCPQSTAALYIQWTVLQSETAGDKRTSCSVMIFTDTLICFHITRIRFDFFSASLTDLVLERAQHMFL